MFGPPREGDVLYALTDGVDDASKIHVEDLEKTFRSKPIRLLLISVRGAVQPRAGAKELKRLQDLAIDTGGATADISGKGLEKDTALLDRAGNPTSVALKLQSLSQSIPRLYRMEIELPAQLKGTERSGVTVTGTTIKSIDVNYSGRLAACSSTTAENTAH